MNNTNNTWLLHLGFNEIPKKWYADRNPGKIDGRSKAKQMPQEYKTAMRKFKRGIAAMIRNPEIETKPEAYQILLERNFVPIADKTNKVMSEGRFYYYWYEVMKERGIKKTANTKAKYIRNNYKTKSPAAIAGYLQTTEHYVRQIILEIEIGHKK